MWLSDDEQELDIDKEIESVKQYRKTEQFEPAFKALVSLLSHPELARRGHKFSMKELCDELILLLVQSRGKVSPALLLEVHGLCMMALTKSAARQAISEYFLYTSTLLEYLLANKQDDLALQLLSEMKQYLTKVAGSFYHVRIKQMDVSGIVRFCNTNASCVGRYIYRLPADHPAVGSLLEFQLQLLRINPQAKDDEISRVMKALSQHYISTGQAEKAISLFAPTSEDQKDESGKSPYLMIHAGILYDLQRWDELRHLLLPYEKVDETVSVDYGLVHAYLGLALLKIDPTSAAGKAMCQSAMTLLPEPMHCRDSQTTHWRSRYRVLLALSASAEGQSDQEQAGLNQLIQLDEQREQLYLAREECRKSSGDRGKSKRYQDAIKHYNICLLEIGCLEQTLGLRDEAEQHFLRGRGGLTRSCPDEVFLPACKVLLEVAKPPLSIEIAGKLIQRYIDMAQNLLDMPMDYALALEYAGQAKKLIQVYRAEEEHYKKAAGKPGLFERDGAPRITGYQQEVCYRLLAEASYLLGDETQMKGHIFDFLQHRGGKAGLSRYFQIHFANMQGLKPVQTEYLVPESKSDDRVARFQTIKEMELAIATDKGLQDREALFMHRYKIAVLALQAGALTIADKYFKQVIAHEDILAERNPEARALLHYQYGVVLEGLSENPARCELAKQQFVLFFNEQHLDLPEFSLATWRLIERELPEAGMPPSRDHITCCIGYVESVKGQLDSTDRPKLLYALSTAIQGSYRQMGEASDGRTRSNIASRIDEYLSLFKFLLGSQAGALFRGEQKDEEALIRNGLRDFREIFRASQGDLPYMLTDLNLGFLMYVQGVLYIRQEYTLAEETMRVNHLALAKVLCRRVLNSDSSLASYLRYDDDVLARGIISDRYSSIEHQVYEAAWRDIDDFATIEDLNDREDQYISLIKSALKFDYFDHVTICIGKMREHCDHRAILKVQGDLMLYHLGKQDPDYLQAAHHAHRLLEDADIETLEDGQDVLNILADCYVKAFPYARSAAGDHPQASSQAGKYTKLYLYAIEHISACKDSKAFKRHFCDLMKTVVALKTCEDPQEAAHFEALKIKLLHTLGSYTAGYYHFATMECASEEKEDSTLPHQAHMSAEEAHDCHLYLSHSFFRVSQSPVVQGGQAPEQSQDERRQLYTNAFSEYRRSATQTGDSALSAESFQDEAYSQFIRKLTNPGGK